ncbi:glutathione S-transferas-like protein [Lophiotrema nucula]|uniref:Glutathione S-transferas-like protein n=1 Tax=Lophiotrema nucula TaxID=690887 RepID=A0A6A5ZN26_9PLEO|nr:glutathione S-transferas-like protein [Lophiotrema nucula]
MSTILYDLPTREKTAWSLNPWKTRMTLNYKKIDYQTEWVEYPDLQPTLSSYGIPPNDHNDPSYLVDYTSPAIRFEDGAYAMDSWIIAQELEKRYPSPSLHLDDPVVEEVRSSIKSVDNPIRGAIIPRVARYLLPDRSREYFERTRAVRLGIPLSQFEKEKGGEQIWEDVKVPAQKFAEVLKRNGGPFFLGEEVSYADFIFVSFLHFLKMANADAFERFLALDPAFPAVYEACKPWLAKND